MILVTGATGHVGAELLTQLAAGGSKTRAMTRRPETFTPPPGVEVVRGDADHPDSLQGAFDGVRRAFLISAQTVGATPTPTHVPHLVRAAQAAGVEHIVLLSVYNGGAGGDPIADWCNQIESAVTSSGMTWTLLRPGRFMSNALAWAPQIRRGEEIAIPFAHRPAASIDPADIAAIAALALTTDDHLGGAYRMSGPEMLTPVQELAVLATLLERPLRAVEPPLAQVRAGMARAGMPAHVLEAVLARALDTVEGTELLPTVADVLGRPPGTFVQWATRHLHHFTD